MKILKCKPLYHQDSAENWLKKW